MYYLYNNHSYILVTHHEFIDPSYKLIYYMLVVLLGDILVS